MALLKWSNRLLIFSFGTPVPRVAGHEVSESGGGMGWRGRWPSAGDAPRSARGRHGPWGWPADAQSLRTPSSGALFPAGVVGRSRCRRMPGRCCRRISPTTAGPAVVSDQRSRGAPLGRVVPDRPVGGAPRELVRERRRISGHRQAPGSLPTLLGRSTARGWRRPRGSTRTTGDRLAAPMSSARGPLGRVAATNASSCSVATDGLRHERP
jgi:hypothetical protein